MNLEQDVISQGNRAFSSEELARARRYSMEIHWSDEDDAYIVSVPELPGLRTHGATHREAVAMGEDAIAVWLDGEETVPAPRLYDDAYPEYTVRDAEIVAPPAFDAQRIEQLCGRLGLSRQAFANVLNSSVDAVRSWEYGRRVPEGPTLRLLEVLERNPEAVLESIVSRKNTLASDSLRLAG